MFLPFILRLHACMFMFSKFLYFQSNLDSNASILNGNGGDICRGVASNKVEEAVAFSLFCARTRTLIGDIIKLVDACVK